MSKIKQLLFKPKWQNKDPAIRARSVALSEDPMLADALPQIAKLDPEPTVRLAALRRVFDLPTIIDIGASDPERQIQEHAQRTIRNMICGKHERSPSLEVRLECYRQIEDLALAEYLVQECTDVAIRQGALARISRPALLCKIAINDPDPEMRLKAADKVTQRSFLERIAREVRRKDKRLFRAVTQRIEQARLDAGDNEILRQKAGEVCHALENLSRSGKPPQEKLQALQKLRENWNALPEPETDLMARYYGAVSIIEASLSAESDGDQGRSSDLKRFVAEARSRIEGRDLDLIQHTLDSGQSMQRDASQLSKTQQKTLEQSLSELVALRDELLKAQEPSPGLERLCEQAETVKPKPGSDRQIHRLEKDWKRVWSSLAEHKPADQILAKRFRAAIQRIQHVLEAQQLKRQEAIAAIGDRLQSLENALETGDLAKAVKAKKRFLESARIVGKDESVENPEFKGRVHAATGRLRELRDWQHWANDKIRNELCEAAESVLGSGMHPDALAEKIKGLNRRWRDLEKGEHLPGDDPRRPSNPGLWRRFRAACDKAFEVAQPYFEKRAEVRDKKLTDLMELCDELEKLAEDRDCDDWALLEKSIGKARRSLRQLPEVPPRERGTLSRRLRQAADSMDKRLDSYYEIVGRRKNKLIEEMQALIDEPDLTKAVAAAKDAQSRWQKAGRIRRRQDQALWKEFRKAADGVFARLHEQRTEERAERKTQSQQLDAIIEELRGLLGGNDEELLNVHGRLNQLQTQWRQVGWSDRAIEKSFEDLVRRIEDASVDARKRQTAQRRKALRDLGDFCRHCELDLTKNAHPDLQSLKEKLAAAGDAIPQGLEKRCRDVLSSAIQTQDSEANAAKLKDLCIQVEFLAGVDTPQEYQQQRMEYQVKRLSDKLSSGGDTTAAEEADQLEAKWLSIGPLPEQEADALDGRFRAALEAFDRER